MPHMDISTLTSGALIRHPSRGLLLGTGPFRESAAPPESGPAFYVNTFRLDDPQPWKIPSSLHSLPEPQGALPPAPDIRWTEPSPDAYAQVFAEIIGQIASGHLVKSVPATPQFGEMQAPTIPGNLSCGPSTAPRSITPMPGGRNRKASAEPLRKLCSTSRTAA